MNTKPLVSVVIPTCGPPDMLTEAVESVLAQDYPALEVIIVDDNGEGSEYQKEAEAIARRFSSVHVPVRYLKYPASLNGAVARNRGIAAAGGEYIALLDDDDVFYPEKISRQMIALESVTEEQKFSFTAFCVTRGGHLRNRVRVKKTDDISRDILLKRTEVPSSGLLLTKACWAVAGGFDESFERHQDWEFVIRIGRACRPVPVEPFCFEKRVCLRNTPADPDLFLEQRRHFLKKMAPFIEKYAAKIKKRIYAVHTGDIGISYLRKGKIRQALTHIGKSPIPIVTLGYMIHKVFTHLWYGITPALKEKK